MKLDLTLNGVLAMPRKTKRTIRTETLLAKWKGLPGEFYMLKGLICMEHPFPHPSKERQMIDKLFDGILIARRMDDMNRETIESVKKNRANDAA